MKCPNCQSARLRVVLTKYTPEDDIVRRRHCLACDYRWYTVQRPEDWLDPTTVFWRGKNLVIFPPRTRNEPQHFLTNLLRHNNPWQIKSQGVQPSPCD